MSDSPLIGSRPRHSGHPPQPQKGSPACGPVCAVRRRMGLPQTMEELGIDDSRLEEMAQKCTGHYFGAEEAIGGLKKLRWQDVLAIYKLAR